MDKLAKIGCNNIKSLQLEKLVHSLQGGDKLREHNEEEAPDWKDRSATEKGRNFRKSYQANENSLENLVKCVSYEVAKYTQRIVF